MDELQTLPVEVPSVPSTVDKSKERAIDGVEEEILDPYVEIRQGNPFPLIAGIQHIDLNYMLDENTPLLHQLCKMCLPLDELLKGRSIEFTKNKEGKTPLHFAVEAKDIQAVYWCLQHEKQLNQRDEKGMTAAMDAVKRGFRAGFMLCAHYGHLDEELPHVAAFVNDVWTLRFLRTLKVDLYKKNPGGITPLGVASHHYSYDAAYYLATLEPAKMDIIEVVEATKSETMIRKLKVIKRDQKYGQSIERKFLRPTLWLQSLMLLILFFLMNSIPEFNDLTVLNVIIVVQFGLLIWMYSPVTHPPKRAINILNMMKPPTFPAGMEICPDCIQVKEQSYQHCEKCGVCVKGFHQHEGSVCIYYGNQGRWYFKELGWLIILWIIVGYFLRVNALLYTTTYIQHFQAIYLLWNNSSHMLTGVPMYLVCYFWMLKKLLKVIALTHMILIGYTYQELMHNERYLYLYKPIKLNDHYRNKRIYLFDDGVAKGLKKAIVNVFSFLL